MRIERPRHELDLGQARIVFTVAELKESILRHRMMPGGGGRVTPYHVCLELIDTNRTYPLYSPR